MENLTKTFLLLASFYLTQNVKPLNFEINERSPYKILSINFIDENKNIIGLDIPYNRDTNQFLKEIKEKNNYDTLLIEDGTYEVKMTVLNVKEDEQRTFAWNPINLKNNGYLKIDLNNTFTIKFYTDDFIPILMRPPQFPHCTCHH